VCRLLTKAAAISLPLRGSPGRTEDGRIGEGVVPGALAVEIEVVPLAIPNDRRFDLAASR